MSEWISVDDDMPVSGVLVLIFGNGMLSGNEQLRQGFLSVIDDKTFCDFMSEGLYGGKSSLDVTHWMPQPAYPKKKKENMPSHPEYYDEKKGKR